MKKENMTAAEIREFNQKVEYNNSGLSWFVDLLCFAIFWPMIVQIIYRRCKYDAMIVA